MPTLARLVRHLGIFALFAISTNAADEISRSEPRVYRNTLSRFLTPIEDVIDKPAVGVDDDTNIVAVLREHMHYVEGNGKIWKLRHNAFRANNDAGVKVLKEQTVHYRRTDQRIYLLMARTVLPDGRKIDIEDQAAFVKTPQLQADISLYTDNAELTIVFPNVVKGAVIEYIALVEDRKPVIGDDAYVAHFFFDNYWPTVYAHQVVDLPTKLADKLQIHTLGDIPEGSREKAGWRRSRLQWEKSDMAALHWEPGSPSLSISGPALKLTTFKDWDEFAGWYRSLLKKPSTLTHELENAVDEWTADLRGPREILDVLLQKVAIDIRYTGLEFGIGGYQPRSCADIWDKQYGDCKDKSNLLRVMLARKGISAHLALLNTEGRGLLDRQAPYHGQFNHVILAVDIDGEYVYCDPTIPYLQPGQLDSGDLDRELLLIKPDGHEFVRTPQQALGTLGVDFELKYEPDARLSGWMTLSATDVWAARYADHFWNMDRRATRAGLHASLQGFFPGAELIDYEFDKPEDWDGQFEIRAYFIVAGTSDRSHASGNLRFPEGGYALPDLGDVRTRSTVYPQAMDTVELSVQYRLPPGWSATKTPSPYKVKSESLDARAKWTVEGNHCRAELRCEKLQAVVSPNEYSVLVNAVAGLKAWVEKTLPVRQGAQTPTDQNAKELEGFDPMPSADGQMALLYALFPEDGSIALRRRALNKVLQWFPNERDTGYTARVELARLLQRENKWAESERLVRQLLEQYANDIDQEGKSWGEYLVASAALKQDRRDEAIQLLEAIAENEANIPFRRSWAYFDAAEALADAEPKRAIELLWSGLKFHSPIYRHIARRQAQLLLTNDRLDELPRLAELMGKAENRGAEAAVATLLDLVQWQLGSDEPERGKALWLALLPLRDAAHLGAIGEQFAATESAVANSAKHASVKGALRHLFAQRAPSWWSEIEIDESWDGPAVDKQLMMAVLRDDLRRYIRLQVESLLRFPQTPDHFSERLWRVLSRLPNSELEGELLPEILTICDMLPADDQIRIESQFIKGEWLSGKGEVEGARKVYEKVMAENDSSSFLAAGCWRLGLLAASEGEIQDARAHFAKGAQLLDDAGEPAIACTVRGIYLDLAADDYDAAIAGINSLVSLDDEDLKDVDTAARIQELIKLATVPDMARRYWASHRRWWPVWTALAEQLNLTPNTQGKALPDPEALRDMIARAVRASDREAAGDALTAIMHSARWQPAYSLLANNMHILVRQIAPAHQQAFRRLNAAMQEAFESPDPEQMQQARISLAAVRLDSADYAGAGKVIHQFFEAYGDDAARAPVMARLQALHAIASNEGIPAATTRVEAMLEKIRAPLRTPLITTLADLYRQQNRVDDEVALLKGELADSGVAGPIRAELERRLGQIRTNSDRSADFSATVRSWLAGQDLPWLAFAKPASLSEVTDVEQARANTGQRYSPFELFKINLLIAQAADQPHALKIDAFDDAVGFLVALCQWRDDANAIYKSLIANEAFDERLKLHWLWTAVTECWIDHDFVSLAMFAKMPLSANFNDRQKRSVTLWTRMGELDQGNPEAISVFCKNLMTKPLGTLELSVLQMLCLRLINLDAIPAAQAIEAALADVPLSAEVDEPRLRLRLRFRKMIALGRDFLPAHLACRNALFTRYPEAKIGEPKHWPRLRENTNLGLLDEDSAHEIQLYLLKERKAMPTDFSSWASIAQGEYHRGDEAAFAFDILRATLDKLTRDEYLAEVIFGLLFAFDIDSEDQIKKALEACAPYRDPRAYPLTFFQIRLYEIMHGLRVGAELDVESELAGINHPAARSRAPHLILRHHLQRKDLPRLRRYLAAMDVDELLSDRNVTLVLPALRLAGMTDEAELVAESAEKTLYNRILQAWATGQSGGSVYTLIKALDRDANVLPEGWLDSVIAQNANSQSRRSLRVLDAELRQDWESVSAVSADLLRTHPTYYHYYWQHGRALYELGKREAALKSLQTYVKFAKDTLHFPEAQELIGKLEGEAGE